MAAHAATVSKKRRNSVLAALISFLGALSFLAQSISQASAVTSGPYLLTVSAPVQTSGADTLIPFTFTIKTSDTTVSRDVGLSLSGVTNGTLQEQQCVNNWGGTYGMIAIYDPNNPGNCGGNTQKSFIESLIVFARSGNSGATTSVRA